ncbi:serpin peptidase inhibitor, clade F (alpha-2 antiplasmin, pigment epithelium derived factor), member 2b [Polyodon spathula]|uniref:serpin peptidase inhibitor, clade F (alpha-2 antiplasmin, pigment epithelium derived factor), member 2b n=1 Tax=Polyodon spathula TaxID=7913 RepID=UPI001B7E6E80|nr:serpin peptidase inhibitor, clade F (alpha-2 antiplasmin, pigment epithelium derived factor), member 2b [Polyodon spathula]
MDSPLLVVLLLCLASPGRTEDGPIDPETSEEHTKHTTLIPSTRTELRSTSEAPSTSPTVPAAHPGVGPTADLPEDLYPQTTSTSTTSETSVPSHTPAPSREPHSEEAQGGGSSEEEVGGECRGAALGPNTTRALGGAMMKFGMEVLETLESKSKKPNILLSPLSVVLGLSQLSLGAVNKTEAMLRSQLHVSELPCYHHLFKQLRQHLSQSALQVATRVYLKKGFKVKEGFMKDSLQFYGSKPALLEGVDEVNYWVEEATKGRIKDFLSSLPGDVVLMLLNAVHFKVSGGIVNGWSFPFPAPWSTGLWQTQFDPRFTSSDVFYLDQQSSVSVDMMQEPKYPLSLFMDEKLEVQVARFPFKGNMSLVLVLPFSGEVNVSVLARSLDAEQLYRQFPKERPIQVTMPKLNLEYSQDLSDTLISMGMGELFTSPNLDRISSDPLSVSSVHHKSSLELKEEGAEAAAATSITISRSMARFDVNKPFFFVLLDDESHVPVFLGIVRNPSAGVLSKGDKPPKMFMKKAPK